MNFLRDSKICNVNFQLPSNSKNENFKSNIKSSINLLDDILDSLDKDLSQSVIDLTKCFICLCQTDTPLSCPKCNNFACKKCLESYFNGVREKKCPLCKQNITLSSLKESEIVQEIQKIINKDDTKKNKVEELSRLIQEKKKIWEKQGDDINIIIEKIFKYQDSLNEYKKGFESFFSECKMAIEKTFEEFNTKVEKVINSLLTYNKDVKNSIIRYNNLDKNNKNNYYIDNNIKNLINEILSMERKHFNSKGKNETELLLETPISIKVYMADYYIYKMNIKKTDFTLNSISSKNKHYKIGNFELKYFPINYDGYKASSELIINLIENENSCLYITQNKVDKDNKPKVFPMKLKKKIGKKFIYEGMIYFDEFDKGTQNEATLNIIVLGFFVN